jgi:hypothetical protein
MLVKSYNHLHFVEDVASSFVNKDWGLSIFQMNSNNAKTTKEILTKELLDIKRFHVDVTDIKNLIEWWGKHESIFLALGLLVK